jgi:hypothetical protein
LKPHRHLTNMNDAEIAALQVFDNDVTVMYKWAFSGTAHEPVKYLVVDSDRKVTSIFTLTEQWFTENLSLLEIYNEILQRTKSLGAMEVSYIYYDVASRAGISSQSIFETINHFYTTLNVANDQDENLDFRLGTITLLRDVNDLETHITDWRGKYQNRLNRDYNTYQRIIEVQRQLARIEPVVASEPIIEVVTLEFRPQWKVYNYLQNPTDNFIESEDGVDIFDGTVPSYTVPFIQWNDDDGKRFYRLYYGSEDTKDRPDYGVIIQHATQASRKNTLYLKIWIGKDKSTPTRESYERCIYFIDEGRLIVQCPVTIDTPGDGERIVTERIAATLSNISLGPSREVKVRGHFNVKDVSIDDASFHYMILTDQMYRDDNSNEKPLFSTYLYIEESIKSRADKKRLNIHYKSFMGSADTDIPSGSGYVSNPASVSVTFGPPESESDGDLHLFDATIQTPTVSSSLQTKSDVLRVNVVRAESRQVLMQFMQVFRRLLRIYMQHKSNIMGIFNYFLGEPHSANSSARTSPATSRVSTPRPYDSGQGYANYTFETGEQLDDVEEDEDEDEEEQASTVINASSGSKPKKSKSVINTKSKGLTARAPHIFVSRYARKCQCPLQPIIIKHDEVEDWKRKTFVENGKEHMRQVMAFPPPQNRAELADPNYKADYWIVCPNDDSPYPTVKKNVDLSNAEKYPFLPCCAKTDMLSNGNSDYYKFYEAKERPGQTSQPRTTSKAGYKMTTMKILAWGRRGKIPVRLAELLQTHQASKDEEWLRCGVGHSNSNSSFLHCVLLATQDPRYLIYESKDQNRARELEIEREGYVISQRVKIAQSIPAAVYRQEMYDMSDIEIIDKIKGNKPRDGYESAEDMESFDPYMMYRGVEETYNVNVFVFNPSGPLYPPPGMASEDIPQGPIMEVPRCKMMHIRVRRLDRPSIIILKHQGAPTDPIKYPRCDLIISRTKTSYSDSQNISTSYLQNEDDDDDDEEKSDDSDDDGPCIPSRTSTVERSPDHTQLPHLPGTTTNRTSTIVGASQAGIKHSYMFNGEMTKLLYDTLEMTSSAYVWSFPKLPETSSSEHHIQSGSSIQTRENPYSKVNWRDVLSSCTIIAQKIDGYGKTRAFNLRMSGSEIITMFIPPTQPVRIPSPSPPTKTANSEDIYRVPENIVKKYFGEPSGRHYHGLWYAAIDFEYAVFIPALIETPVEEGKVPVPPLHYLANADSIRSGFKSTRKISDDQVKPIILSSRQGAYAGSVMREQGYIKREISGAPSPVRASSIPPAVNPIEELQQVRRWAGVLKAVIIWIWRWGGSRSPKEWWNQYVVSDPDIGDIPHKPIRITRRLPTPKSSGNDLSSECIALMSNWWPAYFRNELPDISLSLNTLSLTASSSTSPPKIRSGNSLYTKIHLNPELFKVLLQYLVYYHRITEGLSNDPETRLRDLYTLESDFTVRPKSIVLITNEHLQAWLNHQQRRTGSTTTILTKLNLAYGHLSEPFMYRDINTQKIYLIQNVYRGELLRALHLSLQWHHRAYNTGYMTAAYNGSAYVPHVVYSISTNQTLIAVEDNTIKSQEYVQVLRYKDQYYAAMLPFL